MHFPGCSGGFPPIHRHNVFTTATSSFTQQSMRAASRYQSHVNLHSPLQERNRCCSTVSSSSSSSSSSVSTCTRRRANTKSSRRYLRVYINLPCHELTSQRQQPATTTTTSEPSDQLIWRKKEKSAFAHSSTLCPPSSILSTCTSQRATW